MTDRKEIATAQTFYRDKRPWPIGVKCFDAGAPSEPFAVTFRMETPDGWKHVREGDTIFTADDGTVTICPRDERTRDRW